MKKIIVITMLTALIANQAFADTAPVKAKKKKKIVTEQVDTSMASPTYLNASEAEGTRSPLAGTMVRPLVGMNFSSPKSLNNFLATNNNGNGTTPKVGSALSYGVAVEYPVVNSFYAGIRVEHMSASSDAVLVNPNNNSNMTEQVSVSGTPIMLTGTYMMPMAPRWNFGLTLGAGLGFG